MDENWLIAVPFIWIASIVTVSILLRRQQGKPIFPRPSKTAVFSERSASGNAGGLRALGGARNCLLVSVDQAELAITPSFPFNLGFIAQVWGLEQVIPRRDILKVERHPGLFRQKVVVTYRRNLEEASFTLILRDPAAFERALKT